jgi:hypothetical protein
MDTPSYFFKMQETNSQNNGCKNLFSALPLCQGKKGGNPNLFKAIENLKNS